MRTVSVTLNVTVPEGDPRTVDEVALEVINTYDRNGNLYVEVDADSIPHEVSA